MSVSSDLMTSCMQLGRPECDMYIIDYTIIVEYTRCQLNSFESLAQPISGD